MNNSKKSLVLFIAIAFSAGVIFTNFINPNVTKADTTNIIYTTLDAKISDVASNVSAVQARVTALEGKLTGYDTKISNLAAALKQMASLQKGTLQGGAGNVDPRQIQALTTQVATLQKSIETIKVIQRAQENTIKGLNKGKGSSLQSASTPSSPSSINK